MFNFASLMLDENIRSKQSRIVYGHCSHIGDVLTFFEELVSGDHISSFQIIYDTPHGEFNIPALFERDSRILYSREDYEEYVECGEYTEFTGAHLVIRMIFNDGKPYCLPISIDKLRANRSLCSEPSEAYLERVRINRSKPSYINKYDWITMTCLGREYHTRRSHAF